ncbi:MAG: hypothetical protein ACKO7P_12780, partial [Bacteroidota bacterium]
QQNIQWGPLERSSGSLLSIIPKNDANFYSLRWLGGSVFGSYYIVEHENLSKLESAKIKQSIENGMATLEYGATVKNQPILFLSDKNGKNLCLFFQRLGSNLKNIGPAEQIICYENERLSAQPEFQITQSENKQYLAITYEIAGNRQNQDSYGYAILDTNLTIINKGKYTLPFDGNLATINKHHLSNKGEFYMSVTEHLKPNDKLFTRNFKNYKALHVYQIKADTLSSFKLDFSEKRVEEMEMSSTDTLFTLTGSYANVDAQGTTGVFYMTIDSKKGSIAKQGFIPFSSELTRLQWSDNLRFNGRNFNKNWENTNQLYEYRLRNMNLLSDGSIVGSVEQYYVYSRTNFDNRTGISNSINYYYYDDILAFKIGVANNFDWCKTIQKNQSSINDDGPFSSYANYIDNGKFCIIFNDNINNYNSDGEFSGETSIRPTNFNPRRNAVALVEIDLTTGNASRKSIFKQKEIKSMVLPKLFELNNQNQELILYGVSGSRERFGILKLNKK